MTKAMAAMTPGAMPEDGEDPEPEMEVSPGSLPEPEVDVAVVVEVPENDGGDGEDDWEVGEIVGMIDGEAMVGEGSKEVSEETGVTKDASGIQLKVGWGKKYLFSTVMKLVPEH
jgi:hypothetical protein